MLNIVKDTYDVIEVNLVVLLLTLPVQFADKERKLT